MKHFNLNKFLNILKICLIIIFFSTTLSLLTVFNFSVKAAQAEENYNVENISKEMFGDVTVKSSEYLYSLDGYDDYIYVKYENGGYAVFYKYTMELLEYSASGELNYPNYKTVKYYGGPSMYFTKQDDCFVDVISGEPCYISKSSIQAYSNEVRNTLTSKYESKSINQSVKFDYSSIGENNLNLDNKEFNSETIFYEESLASDIPVFDKDLPIKVTDGTYIPNYNYYIKKPLHGQNQTGTCGAIAAQLLLSYNNYYNDRRIIDNRYLYGGENNREQNPNLCTDPMLMTPYTLGTRGYYEDGRDDPNSYFKYAVDNISRSATVSKVKTGLNNILTDRNNEINGGINYVIDSKSRISQYLDSDFVISEINSGRPSIILMQEDLGGDDHYIVAYGYQNYDYRGATDPFLGYITHFGWKKSGYENVWVNSAWCHSCVTLKIEHAHNYKLVGAIGDTGRTEYKCNTCGHRTDKAPDNVYLDITNVEKSGSIWKVSVENFTDSSVTVFYNSKMCYFSDAQNWTGLKDIRYDTLPANSTKIYTISENTSSTSIALSYIKNDVRYITYADNLNTNGSCRAMYNTKNVPSYTQHRMKIRNLGKSGDKWLIELTNYTNMHRVFEYNTRMCLENDAERWTNLLHVKKVFIPDGKSLILEISEYSMATCIAISYEERIDRSIIFAYSLSANGTMTCRESRLESVYYSENGMEIAIAGKENNTWVIEVTNVSGSLQTFEYNAKMCFEGDAANWNGLSDIRKVSMENNIYTRLRITENGTATSIAISYMDGIYRKVIYARDLNAANRTMTVKGNVIDTTVQDSCLAAGSLITLADGSQKAVENLTGDEILLVWNMQTGTVDYAPIWFIDSTTVCTQDIINLHFSDGTSVKVIYEHGFWNCNLNKYVYMDENAGQYIGDWFNKQTVGENGDYVWEKVQLTNVTYTKEYTTAWSPVTYGHLCYFVNGMLSMPGGIDGLFNIFEVDGETMTYDGQAMANDIERYGLYTYEEFSETFDVPVEIFEAVNAKYFKISIGKGLITYADIENLIQRYSKFF